MQTALLDHGVLVAGGLRLTPAEHVALHRTRPRHQSAFVQAIVGMSSDESDRLLAELRAFATQDRFLYDHRWETGDLVIWDNWRTMHTARGHQKRYARRMHRTTLRADAQLSPWTP